MTELSQCDRVLAVLADGQPHTITEIHARAGFMRLNSRVSELRERGLKITHWVGRDENGRAHHTYQLLSPVEAPPALDADVPPGIRERVDAYLAEHPGASASRVAQDVTGRKRDILRAVRERGNRFPSPAGGLSVPLVGPRAAEVGETTGPGTETSRDHPEQHARGATNGREAEFEAELRAAFDARDVLQSAVPVSEDADVRRREGIARVDRQIEQLQLDAGASQGTYA